MISNIDPNHFKVKHKKCNSKLNQTYFVFIKIQDLNSHAKGFLSNSRMTHLSFDPNSNCAFGKKDRKIIDWNTPISEINGVMFRVMNVRLHL